MPNLGAKTRSWKLDAQRAAATVLPLGVLCLCGWLLLNALSVNAAEGFDPNDVRTSEAWFDAIAAANESLNSTYATLAISLTVIACGTAVAAWHRCRLWLVSLLVSACLLLGTLVLAGGMASNKVSWATDMAQRFVTSTPASVEQDEDAVLPQRIFSIDDADAQVAMLLERASEVTDSRARLLQDPKLEAEPQDAKPMLVREACATPDGQAHGILGSLVVGFSSDESGDAVTAIAGAWHAAGYSLEDKMRSQQVYVSDAHPVSSLSVNDRFTIDGSLTLRFQTDCLFGDSAGE
ncbi:hypothetical protein ICM05_07890 [Leucobacter sp. cx-42]|uniref:hypothetical protein n=1 Tax=unclassified Leucobacter TaxID=2621730 RepID=UPI00165E877D|nr:MULTISPECIES: hypothetical protein [unclassified Leucobacter]MBC9954565.1 hypothetical protein [Leucobacter sp. cx-42]